MAGYSIRGPEKTDDGLNADSVTNLTNPSNHIYKSEILTLSIRNWFSARKAQNKEVGKLTDSER
jgi:hypothetical protein